MKILAPDVNGIAQALKVLKEGGVVAHATETCYGLACDITNPEAVRKLFAIKRRPEEQPVSALFSTVHEAKRYVVWGTDADELALQYLPGPLTLIVPIREKPLHSLYPTPGGGSTVGVRVSPHRVALALAEGFRRPLTTTSANIHGQPNPYSVTDIRLQFKEGPSPDLVLDSGTLPQNPPSTVMNLADPRSGVVRKGSIGLGK